jgi:hypothetical protein
MEQWMKQDLNSTRLAKIWVSLNGENLAPMVHNAAQNETYGAIFLKIWISLMPGLTDLSDFKRGEVKLICAVFYFDHVEIEWGHAEREKGVPLRY